ncbi:MAG: hypothetical protein IJ634_04720 [Bacteroidales bacterium]|nr:hypothetical protein [Bacteroidales bacterium]
MEASTNYWVQQISHKRKPWIIRNIWWFILGIAVILATMLVTNPKDEFKHNRAVQHCVENRIYPLTIETMKQEIRNDSKSKPSDDKATMNTISVLLSGFMESNFMSYITINGLVEEFAVDRIDDHHLFSIGYSNGRKMTIGLFGKTWMFADFMSDKKLMERISEYLNNTNL